MPTSIPTATYRLQFHKGFPFSQATALVPYLHALGITHIYASPFFRATPGSLHGYDVCDHNALNPEVGTREEFDQFVETMHRHGIGLILDFVPNHMGIAEKTNTWWMDILENGPSSVYARFFDIDWHPLKPELEQKVLLPILGDQYGRILESRDLKLHFDEGAFYLDYFGRRLPLSPRTSRPLLERACRELKEAGREAPAELQSIAFTLEHLPDNNETDPVKIEERTREQKIVKSRLRRLCEEQSEVEEAIQEVITDIQSGGKRHDFHAYDQLLRQQSYRLAYWRVAAEEINYRRFFDINNLGAIRMELPEVFDATHRLVMELLASGAVSGLRIDHVDGLWDPRDYLTKLQERYGRLRGESPGTKPLYLLVEKILARGEGLRGDWPVHGTTGYEAAIQIASVLVDPAAEADFTKIYTGFINTRVSYMELTYRSKLLVMRLSMASEVNVLGHMLNRLSETNQWYRDFTLNALTTIIREVIACFPVYRTYLTPDGKIAEEDRHIIFRALSLARRRNPGIERTIFDFLRDVLMPPEPNPHPVDELGRLDFVMKFQQCTGPITAKGIEDTAFYIYNRLVALNEVGGEPHVFGETVDAFHRQNIERFSMFPHSLVATSTHDTKRSEDVRARIAALSEMPQEWMEALQRWQSANREHPVEIDGEIAPDSNEEYLLYQTLLGSWPLAPMSEEERKDYISRIQEYMTKALHEAKVNSSWTEPNTAWDQAVSGFVQKILTPGPGNAFLGDFETMAHRIAELGMINSLAQTVLKMTIPGVPDIYQGQELWDFSLVDPDNRRPVDFDLRAAELERLRGASPTRLLEEWRDGRIKLLITHQLLTLRKTYPDLFQSGTYLPLKAEGEFARSCIAFQRQEKERSIVVIVPRLSSQVATPPLGDAWKDTCISNNHGFQSATELFTGLQLPAADHLFLRDALRELPVAVYVSNG